MATFKLTRIGALYLIEATGKVDMVTLTRTSKEYFTDFVSREAKAQKLKVVVNGSFTDLSSFNSIAVQITSGPLDPSESKPIGEVIEQGKQIAGSSSPGKFYFSQNTCGVDTFTSGQGDPPGTSCAAVGGVAPIVVNGMPYGTFNQYGAGVPADAPMTGDVEPKYQKYLTEKSNAMFTQLLGKGASVGKVAIGYSNAKQKLLLVVQQDGNAAGLDAKGVRAIFTAAGAENAVFMDCSNSATLWYDGKIEVAPSNHKNEYLNVAVGFK
ncbi:MAG TPA: phosphodiester glycosidase family protein [Bryobacteraceae bacterium]|nr:phosphodiester glycosidase family protein [Bryobacteraceae bacterium]